MTPAADVVITLSTRVELGHAPRDVEGLACASAEDLRAVETDSLGLGYALPPMLSWKASQLTALDGGAAQRRGRQGPGVRPRL